MTKPTVALRDEQSIRHLCDSLPQSLLIVAERGLDGAGVADCLAHAEQGDVRYVSLAEDKNSIGIEEVREITIALRTRASSRRVIIITEAHKMTEEAQNAFLKSLEEPGEHTHFILVTEHSDALLTTIRSRCQQLVLHRTSSHQDALILKSFTRLSTEDTAQILFLAAGRPVLLRQLASEPRILDQYKAVAGDAKTILANQSSYESLYTIQTYVSDRKKALQLLEIMLTILRFQSKQRPVSVELTKAIERVVKTEMAIRANANVRLALAQVVLY